MKLFFSLILSTIFCCTLNAQTIFEVNLDDTRSTVKFDKVDMFDYSQKEHYSKPYNKKVKFTFKKKQIDLYFIVFFAGEKRIRQQLWLNAASTVKINAHVDSMSLKIDTVLNSPIYYSYPKVFNEVENLVKAKDTLAANNLLIAEYSANSKNPYGIAMANKYVNINSKNKKALRYLKTLVDKNGDKLKWHHSYVGLIEKLNLLSAEQYIQLSEYAFINTNNIKGEANFKNADYVILDFWFLQCAGCLKDHKLINKTIPLFKDKNIEIISISTDEYIEPWKKYLTENEYNWQNLYIGKKHELYSKLNLNSFPYYVVIAKNGEIKTIQTDFDEVLKFFDIKIN